MLPFRDHGHGNGRIEAPFHCGAASHFLLNQLPELYGGLQRDPTNFPVHIMDRASVRVADWAAAYRKSGWTTYDPTAKPLTRYEVIRERSLYR
jgi:hypothetical protein